jgi:hypothetical protein
MSDERISPEQLGPVSNSPANHILPAAGLNLLNAISDLSPEYAEIRFLQERVSPTSIQSVLAVKATATPPAGENGDFDKLTRDQQKIVAYLLSCDGSRASVRELMKQMGKQYTSTKQRRSFMQSMRRLDDRLAEYYPHLGIDQDRKTEMIALVTRPVRRTPTD